MNKSTNKTFVFLSPTSKSTNKQNTSPTTFLQFGARIRGNNFLAYYTVTVPELPSVIPQGYNFYIMDYSRRQEFSRFYSGLLRPYWSYKQPGQPSVLVVHIPVPVRMENRSCFEADIHAEMHKSKSRAQRYRDFKRRQTFHAKKSTCAMMVRTIN